MFNKYAIKVSDWFCIMIYIGDKAEKKAFEIFKI